MRQKYIISINQTSGDLYLKELAEVDKDMFSLLCEETYRAEVVNEAIAAGRNALVEMLRTQNLYPPAPYAEKIAAAVVELYSTANDESIEMIFDDRVDMEPDEFPYGEPEDLDDDTVDIDELLDDDF